MTTVTRRRLLQLSTGTLASAAFGGRFALAHSAGVDPVTLRAISRTLEIHGKPARVFGLAQANGAAGLFAKKGGRFRAELVNELDTETLIHWHGLTPPSEQDGVPGLSQPALKAGNSYDYDFVHNRAGTHWMHSHVGLQEQQLLAAPLIVHDPAEAHLDEQEVVVLLHDFNFRAPEEVFEELRRDAAMAMPMDEGAGHGEAAKDGGMAMTRDSHGQMTSEAGGGMATGEATGEAMGTGQEGMSQEGMSQEGTGQDHGGAMVHFNDVDYDAYLANDRTLADPEVVRIAPGGRVRLRIINAAAATNFLMDLGALEGELVTVDGNPVSPLRGSQFDLAIAQRADIRLRLPAGQGDYPVLARREDGMARTGIILATKTGQIARLSEQGDSKSRPLDLQLERRLSALAPLTPHLAERTHVLDLTGSHAGYDWGFNEMSFDPDKPIFVAEGERVEVILRNKTAMPHPIHLHGHHFQVVGIDGRRFAGAVRDTVLVPPARAVTIAFDADNPGHWAFHCHQLYHMAAGMMTSVKYEGYRLPGG